LPGIEVNTGPPNFAPIERLKVMRFKGGEMELLRRHHQHRDPEG
jgi:branched-chain amino acid transport system substrate-binding protein